MKPLRSSANKDKRQGQVRAEHTMQGQARQIVGIGPGLGTFATSTSVWQTSGLRLVGGLLDIKFVG